MFSTLSLQESRHQRSATPTVFRPNHKVSAPTYSVASCACGGSCPRCRQSRVAMSQPGDASEHEADRAAYRVMRGMPAAVSGQSSPALSRQASTVPGDVGASAESLHQGLQTSAQPLDASTRSRMESAYAHDFSAVRIHAGAAAASSAASLHARAYTWGSDIVFAAGEYAPQTHGGRHLLTHELAHVVQQSNASPVLQRSEDERGSASASACAANANCPSDFCQPLPWDRWEQCVNDIPFLLAGIALKVSSRVVSLWHDYLSGGSGLQDLSSRFGSDFTHSATTADTTDFLVRRLRASLIATPSVPAFPGMPVDFVDIPSRIGPDIAAIGTAGDVHEMNFDVIGEIPGNIAGGIGANQAACPVGARPSTQDDSRTASGTAHVMRQADGSALVMPFINYTVRDTIDLCPGNCGSGEGLINEQLATLPMSRCEASGIYGDVPFVVNFPAPFRSFTLPAPAGP